MQGVCVRFAFTSKLVLGDGVDLRFSELSQAEKVTAQNGLLVGIIVLVESLGYGIRNGGFAGASLTGQPEDTRAVQRVSPIGDIFQYLDARSGRTLFTLQALENGFVVSLLGGTQTFPDLFNRSVSFTSQEVWSDHPTSRILLVCSLN